MVYFQYSLEQADLVCHSVIIQIAQEDLEILKNGRYRLCIAMKVENHDYNVIGQAYLDYMINNQIMIYSGYAAFGTQYFTNNSPVFASTNTVDILTGQITTVESSGYLTDAVSGGVEHAINYNNEYNGIHLGVGRYLTNLYNETDCAPIFVSKTSYTSETIHFTPENKLLIWFEQNVESGTMSSNIYQGTGGSSMSEWIEVSIDQADVITVHYEDGEWKKV